MARPKQPIELILAKGKSHLSKREVEERQQTQVKAKCDNVKAPDFLPKDLVPEFDDISKQLMELEIFSNLDVDTLARYLIAKKLYEKYTDLLLTDAEFNDKIVNAQDKYFKQCRLSASDLGLNISSRCRLVIPKKENKKKDSRDERFGDV